MIHTTFAIMKLFLNEVCHFQNIFANPEYDAMYQCCKIPSLDFGAHHVKLCFNPLSPAERLRNILSQFPAFAVTVPRARLILQANI
jgi:hypothetical protein